MSFYKQSKIIFKKVSRFGFGSRVASWACLVHQRARQGFLSLISPVYFSLVTPLISFLTSASKHFLHAMSRSKGSGRVPILAPFDNDVVIIMISCTSANVLDYIIRNAQMKRWQWPRNWTNTQNIHRMNDVSCVFTRSSPSSIDTVDVKSVCLLWTVVMARDGDFSTAAKPHQHRYTSQQTHWCTHSILVLITVVLGHDANKGN